MNLDTATREQLANALKLRVWPALLFASAFHGGKAIGFEIAISDTSTSEIEAAMRRLGATDADIREARTLGGDSR